MTVLLGALPLSLLAPLSSAQAAPSVGIDCVAIYAPAGAKLPGQPQELHLKNYGCGQEADRLNSARAARVMIKMWEHRDYTGASVELKAEGAEARCDGDGYRWSSFPDGWNDWVSSFRTYQSCTYVRLYEHVETSGNCKAFYDDQSYVGDDWNDKASSLRAQSVSRNC
ncbi:hypothetical protein BS329_20960 [Amycolatopsis coloradensis]|uniref:Beta/gamma crystallin 'Greek key' domain-containing protein n=1 Tax=Amycolatopsis coloradensis TaxID=76021 RepID=A0A1R0KQY0_9PSEU|nr:hypothetical protein [Amycolatopsis coloradensis]OLZ50092.1 hypothetical protein BS329_20960 [Amycolatopsis coloradensis]